jgi:pyruvate dehydrogenase E1 component alpha subunit
MASTRSASPGHSRAVRDPAAPALDVRLGLYRTMVECRKFEVRAQELFFEGLVRGTTHLGVGQEAVAAGFGGAMHEDDYSFATYRGHNHALARGAPMAGLYAELFGRATGLMGGKGGSMHITSAAHNMMGSYAIVGAHLPIALGAAWSAQYRKSGQVAVCFFGDGTTNIGAFHEALNMAALWKLPAIYLCENNRYGMGTALERASALYDISERACSYDMANEVVDGQDVLTMNSAMERAVQRARNDKLPTLLEVRTYRFMGHSMSDPIHGHYRTREEVEDQRKRDPIMVWSQRLIADSLMDEGAVRALDKDVMEEVEDAYQFADQAPDPEPGELFTDVYAGEEREQ